MKVTIIGPLPPVTGGISAYCLRQAESLSRLMDVDVVSFRSPYPAILYKGHAGTGRRPASRKTMRIKYLLRWYNPLTWILAGLRPQSKIVHIHWWTYYLFPMLFTAALAAKLRRKKLVCTAHNIVEYESNVFDMLLRRIFFRLPDMFIVHSHENKNALVKMFHVAETKIVVIPMGIFDVHGKSVDSGYAKKHIGLDKKSKVVLYFGQIRKYKGVDTLIHAFREVNKHVKNSTLIIAGKPWVDWAPYNHLIERYSLKKVVVVRLGFVPSVDVKYYFSAADIVVLPYRNFEAQSAIGNIALSFGKPLLVTDVGSLKDLVLDRRAITKAGDADFMGKKIAAILNNKHLLTTLTTNSKTLRKAYSWNNIADKTAALYKKLGE